MPNRIIKESIRTSYEVDVLSTFAETTFYRLITYADDYGRFIADARILKSQLYPLKDISIETIKGAINEICKSNLIQLYKGEDDKPYGYFINWQSHQTIRNQKSKYPQPTELNFNTIEQLESNCKQLQSIASKCSRNPIQSNPNPNQNPIQHESEIFPLTIESFKDDFFNEFTKTEKIASMNHVQPDQIQNIKTLFFESQTINGETYQSVKDVIRHFNHWIEKRNIKQLIEKMNKSPETNGKKPLTINEMLKMIEKGEKIE